MHIKNNILFSIMQCGYWCSWVCINMFIVFYLQSIELSPYKIGLILTFAIIAGTIGQYFFGNLCDKLKTIKKVLLVCSALINVIIFILPIYKVFNWIIVIYCIFMFFQSAIPSLIDSWIIEFSDDSKKNYSKIRGTASITFALLSLVFGGFVEQYGYVVMSIGFTVFNSALIVSSILMHDVRLELNSKQEVNIKDLFYCGKFIMLCASVILLCISNNFIMNFMSYIVKNVGGSAKQIGYVFFVAALSELPIFLLFTRVSKKIKIEKILFFSSIFFVIRIVTLIFVNSAMGLYLNALIQGLSFALFYCGVRIYVPAIVPKNLRITAQAIVGACINGIAYLMASSIGGYVLESTSIIMVYVLFTITTVAGLIGFLMIVKRSRCYNENISN